MKKTFPIIAVVVVLAGLGIALLAREAPVTVRTAPVARGEFLVTVFATATATVKADEEAILSAQRVGRITRLPVEVGDAVKKGAILVELDLSEEEVQRANVRAQARAVREESERTLQRMEDLFRRGYVARQEVDAARRAAEVARAQHEAAEREIRISEGYSRIQAPFDGVIATQPVEVGELVTVGKPIVTVVNLARLYILATIDEVDAGRIHQGQPVIARLDAFPDRPVRGYVDRIGAVVTGGKLETRTFEVWIRPAEKDPGMKPGMSADIEIQTARVPETLYIPTQAVLERGGKKQVYVAEGGKAVLRSVETGHSNWNFTEVKAGLMEGDPVVVTPDAVGLHEGGRVRVE
ncbi:MAG: efflux RND transporter periplasmic adaptor subunit [Nitrospirae bacterium]|nr:efflux RND transporter periplasmic adaptor subunit [Nitrospirota bacterium]